MPVALTVAQKRELAQGWLWKPLLAAPARISCAGGRAGSARSSCRSAPAAAIAETGAEPAAGSAYATLPALLLSRAQPRLGRGGGEAVQPLLLTLEPVQRRAGGEPLRSSDSAASFSSGRLRGAQTRAGLRPPGSGWRRALADARGRPRLRFPARRAGTPARPASVAAAAAAAAPLPAGTAPHSCVQMPRRGSGVVSRQPAGEEGRGAGRGCPPTLAGSSRGSLEAGEMRPAHQANEGHSWGRGGRCSRSLSSEGRRKRPLAQARLVQVPVSHARCLYLAATLLPLAGYRSRFP